MWTRGFRPSAGVDDYLTKPFNLGTPCPGARLAAPRRLRKEARGRPADCPRGSVRSDRTPCATWRAQHCPPQREFELLLFLVRHADAVQSRQTILDAVRGAPFVGDPKPGRLHGLPAQEGGNPRAYNCCTRCGVWASWRGWAVRSLEAQLQISPPPGPSPISNSPCIARIKCSRSLPCHCPGFHCCCREQTVPAPARAPQWEYRGLDPVHAA